MVVHWIAYLFQSPIVIKHLGLILSGVLLGVLTFLYFSYGQPVNPDHRHILPVLSGVAGVMVVYVVRMLSEKLDRVISWKVYPGLNLFFALITNFIGALSVTIPLLYAYTALLADGPVSFQLLIRLGIVFFIGILIYSVGHFSYRSYAHYQRMQVEAIRLETKQIDLQLMALKTQLSPHFLFNSLNTISSLMYHHEKAAEAYVRSLAIAYQYTLPGYEKKWVSLGEELEYVKAYFHLMATRFGNQLRLEIRNEEEMQNVKIPPLTLQMLVENAVKHNRIGPEDALIIQIFTEANWLVVTNNKTVKARSRDSFGIGLKNINERYEILSGRSIRILENESFTVKLPLS